MKREPGEGGTLAAGNEALARGDWAAARAIFAALTDGVSEDVAAAEALEGLGMAAWWLDDGPTMFAAREQAFRSYRQRGAARAAGRVAMTLAENYFYFRGETAVAQGWYRRAHSLLDGLPVCPEQGWLALWEGDFEVMLGGDAGRVRVLASAAGDVARALADLDLEMAARALLGLALVTEGDLARGMPCLDEASTAALSGEMNDLVAVALACCYQVTACERIRDFGRAAEWVRHVKRLCERRHMNVLLAVCRTQHAGVLLWSGDWDEAERELAAAQASLEEIRPAMQSEAILRLAELRRLQGRLDEAGALLKEVEAHPLAPLARAALALDRDDLGTAEHLAQRALTQLPPANRTERAAAIELLVRVRARAGGFATLVPLLDELRAAADALGTVALRAAVAAAEGVVAAAAGDHARARGALEDAVALYLRSGGAFLAARARFDLGSTLVALGDRAAAAAAFADAHATLHALGAAREAGRAQAALHALEATPPRLPADEMLAAGRGEGKDPERAQAARAATAPDRGSPSLRATTAPARVSPSPSGVTAPGDWPQRGAPPGDPAPAPDSALSEREREVLRLVADGLSNQQIAKRLHLSPFTVKRHVANILDKLDLPSRAAAAAYAARHFGPPAA